MCWFQFKILFSNDKISIIIPQRPYRINSPEIHYPIDELADQYNITKSKQYCITWSYGDTDAEILDAITGLTNME